eukprot:TRINITY_DN2117_c0_g2_i1.p1 TRINITY_DN2117_c0_g2~~TRINITY_DN2117_c0_g2_i1.p1  ORF type:complete len:549 (+),score=89.12 TRINITY_DN2117_c0_g2_i1:780-2426(+)
MFVFGGNNSKHQTQNCDILQFDVPHSKWLKPLPMAADFCGTVFACAVAHAGAMIAFGGRSSRYTSNVITVVPSDKQAIVTMDRHESAPPPVFGAATVAHSGCLVMFGGYDAVTSSPCDRLCRFMYETSKWDLIEHSPSAPFPPARYHHTAVEYNASMIIFGGIGPVGKWLNDLWILDLNHLPTCRAIAARGTLPPPMRGHAACIAQGNMFVFGCAQNSTVGKLFCLDLSVMAWSELTVGGTPISRDFHSLVSVDNRLLVLFGGQERTTKLDDVLGDCRALDLGCNWIQMMPPDLWIEILRCVDFMTLIRVSRTCHMLYNIAKSEPLWSKARDGDWSVPLCPKGCCPLRWENDDYLFKPGKIPTKPPFSITLPSRRSSSPACFGPTATAMVVVTKDDELPVASQVKMEDLKVGDKVETGNGSTSVISCIWKVQLTSPILLVTTHRPSNSIYGASVLEITPDHPIYEQGQWTLPTTLGEARKCSSPCVYNLSLEEPHRTILVGGTVCCTLGLPVPGFPEPFWGSEKIISWLKSRLDFPYITTSDLYNVPM